MSVRFLACGAMWKVLILFFCVFPFVLEAAPVCVPQKSLEGLVTKIKKDIGDLNSEFEKEKGACTSSLPVSFASLGEIINAQEFSPDFKKSFSLSKKNPVVDKHLSGFPADVTDAQKEYAENLPQLEELQRKTSLQGYRGCVSEAYEDKLKKAYEFHMGVQSNVLPSAITSLQRSKTLTYASPELLKVSKKLSKELSVQNQKICKDKETMKEGGLSNIKASTAKLVKSQSQADKKARSGKPEPLPPSPKMPVDFKIGVARSDRIPEGEAFPSEFAVSTEKKPEVEQPKTFLKEPVDWLIGKVNKKENDKSSVRNEDYGKTRDQETQFRARHEAWKNDRNALINRVKDVSGVRTDGFAKKFEYTFTIINKINEQLVETLGYKDTVCKCQKNPTYDRCEKS